MPDGHHEAELETINAVEITPKPVDDKYRLLAKSTLAIVRLQEQLTASHIDSTTGLPNRYTFDQRYDRLFWRAKQESGRHLGLMIGDLDYLKDINDAPGYGHTAGDEYLRISAQALQFTLRPQDQVYRVGGDEFAAILPGIWIIGEEPRPELDRIVDRVRKAVDKAIAAASLPKGLDLGISLGFDIVRAQDKLPVDTVNRVDQLMYIDKHQRRSH